VAEERGEEIIWALVDGFLLYWNPVYPFRNPYYPDFDMCPAGYRPRVGYPIILAGAV